MSNKLKNRCDTWEYIVSDFTKIYGCCVSRGIIKHVMLHPLSPLSFLFF